MCLFQICCFLCSTILVNLFALKLDLFVQKHDCLIYASTKLAFVVLLCFKMNLIQQKTPYLGPDLGETSVMCLLFHPVGRLCLNSGNGDPRVVAVAHIVHQGSKRGHYLIVQQPKFFPDLRAIVRIASDSLKPS